MNHPNLANSHNDTFSFELVPRKICLGVIAPVLALASQYALSSALGQHMPMLLFLNGVAVVAIVGGGLPGLVATGASVALTLVATLKPGLLFFTVPQGGQWTRLALFTLSSVGISILAESLHRLRRREQRLLAEAEITSQALRASKEAAELARSVAERAQADAEAASKAKDHFLATLSHELRNPLNPVLLLASELEADSSLSEAARADWALVRKNVSMEARLIDDLLDLTSIARGKLALDVRRINIHAVLDEAIATVKSELGRKDLHLIVSPSIESNQFVWGDTIRLQQVFWNILRNAVKFSAPGGQIEIHSEFVEGLVSEPARLRICVRDHGIGMSREELAHVFDAFSQGEHASAGGSHRFGGLGLGMAITKQLVQMHSGRIHAASSGLGLGAEFTVELPLITAPCTASSPAVPPAAPGCLPHAELNPKQNLRLLLVEDHDATRTTLSRLLQRRGYVVETASSLAEARDLVSCASFDLLVSDIGLPDGEGHELMREMRAMGSTVRGIALSGYGMEEDRALSRQVGFACHLIKPVEIGDLDRALTEIQNE